MDYYTKTNVISVFDLFIANFSSMFILVKLKFIDILSLCCFKLKRDQMSWHKNHYSQDTNILAYSIILLLDFEDS